MVRVYAKDISRFRDACDRSDHATGPEIDPANRHVRYLGHDRPPIDRVPTVARAQCICRKRNSKVHRTTLNIVEGDHCCTVTVRVIPRSSRSEIVGEVNGELKVRLNSPPVDGAANAELVKLFARELGIARSAVSIVTGSTSRTKRLRVDGVTAEQLQSVVA